MAARREREGEREEGKMKVSSEIISETFEQMRRYHQDNFGIPNGPDYPEIARVFSESDKAMIGIMVSTMIVGMSSKELATGIATVGSVPGLSEQDRARLMANVISKSGVFPPFAEFLYLGYLIGKRCAEIEQLERGLK